MRLFINHLNKNDTKCYVYIYMIYEFLECSTNLFLQNILEVSSVYAFCVAYTSRQLKDILQSLHTATRIGIVVVPDLLSMHIMICIYNKSDVSIESKFRRQYDQNNRIFDTTSLWPVSKLNTFKHCLQIL